MSWQPTNFVVADPDFGDVGLKAHVQANRTLSVALAVPIAPTNFVNQTSVLPPWQTASTGSGSSIIADAQAVVSSGAATSSSGTLWSSAPFRLIEGIPNTVTLALKLNNKGSVGNTRRWGVFNDTQGFFWELQDLRLFFVARSGGVDTRTESIALSGKVPPSIDTGLHAYVFRYLGSAFVYQDSNPVHTQSFTMLTAFGPPHLPARFESINTTSTENNTITVLNVSALRWGIRSGVPKGFHIAGAGTYLLKQSPGHLQSVTINDGVAGNGTFSLYDGTDATGRLLAVIRIGPNTPPVSLNYDISLSVGLFGVWSGESGSVTVMYD